MLMHSLESCLRMYFCVSMFWRGFIYLFSCRGKEGKVELNEREERTICLIINTSEYCSTLCKQLASTVQSTIDKEFSSKVDMKKEQQEFSG
jgi:hypothetical protein